MKRVPVTIKNLRGSIELDKRTFVNAVLTAKCPKCGKKVTKDLRDNYLSYPRTNTPIVVNFHCHDADWNTCCEFEGRVVLRLTIEVVPAPKPRPTGAA